VADDAAAAAAEFPWDAPDCLSGPHCTHPPRAWARGVARGRHSGGHCREGEAQGECVDEHE